MAEPIHSSKTVLGFSLWLGFVTGVLDAWASKATVIPYAPDLAWIYPLLYPMLFACVGLASVAAVRVARSRDFYWAFFLLFSISICDLGTTLFLHPFSVHVIVMVMVFSLVGGLVSAKALQNHPAVARRVISRSALLFMIYAAGCAAIPWVQHLREDRIIASVPSTPVHPPNVLLIIVDTLRADHLSEYGYFRATSPNSAALAARGVLFEDAIAAAPWTLPSHASMLTGLYPSEHGAVDLQNPLGSGFVTIGEALEQRGYTTAAFSANSGLFCRRFGFARGFMHFDDYGNTAYRVLQTPLALKVQKTLAFLGLKGALPSRQSAAEVNTHALQWLERYPHQPFFVTLNYFDVHFPYLPPPAYAHRFSGESPPHAGADVDAWLHSLKPAQVQQEKDAYDSAIAYVDAQLGVLMGELQRRQLLENTIIVFTSDHGEGLGEHGFMNHGNSLYRELIHVPLIIAEPGKIRAGLRVTQPVGLSALPATLLAMVDARSNNPFRGPALDAWWNGSAAQVRWPDPVSQLEARPEKAAWLLNHEGSMDSIVTADWHLITGGKRNLELFNRARDAAEVSSVARKPEMKPVVDTLQASLERSLGAPGANAPTGTPYLASGNVTLPPSGDQAETKKSRLKSRRNRKIDRSHKPSSDELLHALGYVP